MFILTKNIQLYSKKFITDLATRDGAPDKNSVCPMDGCYDYVTQYYNENRVARLEDLFQAQIDFDADKVKPVLSIDELNEMEYSTFTSKVYEVTTSKSFNPSSDTTDFNGYYRRLEDIHPYYLRRYIENVTYNVRNKSGGIKDFEKEHYTQKTFIVEGEDGTEFIDSADLISMKQADTEEIVSIQEAELHLPYVVKRLWSLSKISKIHILEYIRAYHIARDANIRDTEMNRTTASLTSNQVIGKGIHSVKENGIINKAFPITIESRNIHAVEVFKWITRQSNQWQSFYMDYRNFMIYCKVLNIDLVNDDLLQYDNEFIKHLIVRVVTPNTQYNALVAEALHKNDKRLPTVKPQMSLSDAVQNTIDLYTSYYTSNADEQKIYERMSSNERMNIKRWAQAIYAKYRRVRYNNPFFIAESRRISWEKGFMCYDDEPVLINLNFVYDGFSTAAIEYSVGLISDTGFMVHVTPGVGIQRVLLNDIYSWCVERELHPERSYYKPKWRYS